MQQLLECCGEVQDWRRGRDAKGAPLSFGWVLFGDIESAWKCTLCMSKRELCGQEIKIMVEEKAEAVITQWRAKMQSKTGYRPTDDNEVADWELDRRAAACRAQIDAKVEEIFGPAQDG